MRWSSARTGAARAPDASWPTTAAGRSIPSLPAETGEASGDRRRDALRAGREPGSQPHTEHACLTTSRQKSSAVLRGSGVLRTSSQSSRYSPRSLSQCRAGRRQRRLPEPIGSGEREPIERGARVACVAGPPADLDLLGVARVAHDEVVRRWLDRVPREQADREIEASPPGVHRRGTPAIGRGGPRERGRRASPRRSSRSPVRRRTWRARSPHRAVSSTASLAGRGSMCTGPDEVVDRGEQLAGHLCNGPVRREGDPAGAPVAVLGDRIVTLQIEGHDEGARSVGRRERQGLPSPGREPQRSVLQLGLGWSQRDRQLAEHLCVRVQRVAGGPPRLVAEARPTVRAMRSR